MRVYEEKEVVKKEKVLKTIKCDTCKNDINEMSTDHYYTVVTSHGLWGNDSCDSYESMEFCGYECLVRNMAYYFSDADDTYSYDIEREDK
jgi:hypothetical protein